MQTTEEYRAKRAAYMREWKRNNPEKVNAINRRVKAKNPELYRGINRASMAKMRAEDPVRFNTQRWQWREDAPELYLFRHAQLRARKNKLEFDLSVEDIVIPTHCPVLGIKLEWGFGQRASANKASPSLDRMDPTKGYVRGNIFVVSNRANHLKNNGTLDEFKRIIAYMQRGA